jgi:hypothetical protein
LTGSIRSAPADGIRKARAAGRASPAQLVRAQPPPPPLPPPAGASDLALTATASRTSPSTTLTATSDGIYPVQPSDDNNLTPCRGSGPEQGTRWA